jgi:hypothetical protein
VLFEQWGLNPAIPLHTESVTTGGDLYDTPLGIRITIKSLDKNTTYYEYNSFNPSTGRIIYARVSTSLSSNGSFKIQFLDNDLSLDRTNIRSPSRVYIEVGKNGLSFKTIFSGMIRSHGVHKGYQDNILYSIEGFGSGIRRNERILDVEISASKLEDDGVTIDTTDSDFFLDNIVDETLDNLNYFPDDVILENKEGQSGLEYIDSTTTQQDSIIEDFIPSLTHRFDEIQDVHDVLEDLSGARIFVDVNDKIQVQPKLTPSTANYGYLITDIVDKVRDNGENTIYIRGPYNYDFHYSKDNSYSSKLYSILPPDPAPDIDDSAETTFLENKTVEIAQRFKPPTNPNWRLYAAVEAIGMTNVESENSVRGRWRICLDNNKGFPQDQDGIIENRYMYPNKHYNTSTGGLQVIQISKENPSTDLDSTKWYWLILSSVNATSTIYWRWYHNNSVVGGNSATAAVGTSSDVDGGTGWTTKRGPKMELFIGRFKGEPYACTDHKAVESNILIDSFIPSFPQHINTKIGAVKYSVGLMANVARPKPIWNFSELTVPNNIPVVGDMAVVRDSKLFLSTSGQPVSVGQITDIELIWGSEDGGSDPSSMGPTRMSLNLVGYPLSY